MSKIIHGMSREVGPLHKRRILKGRLKVGVTVALGGAVVRAGPPS